VDRKQIEFTERGFQVSGMLSLVNGRWIFHGGVTYQEHGELKVKAIQATAEGFESPQGAEAWLHQWLQDFAGGPK